jgi:hypothetical protein
MEKRIADAADLFRGLADFLQELLFRFGSLPLFQPFRRDFGFEHRFSLRPAASGG